MTEPMTDEQAADYLELWSEIKQLRKQEKADAAWKDHARKQYLHLEKEIRRLREDNERLWEIIDLAWHGHDLGTILGTTRNKDFYYEFLRRMDETPDPIFDELKVREENERARELLGEIVEQEHTYLASGMRDKVRAFLDGKEK